jgi:hypothetical protein
MPHQPGADRRGRLLPGRPAGGGGGRGLGRGMERRMGAGGMEFSAVYTSGFATGHAKRPDDHHDVQNNASGRRDGVKSKRQRSESRCLKPYFGRGAPLM